MVSFLRLSKRAFVKRASCVCTKYAVCMRLTIGYSSKCNWQPSEISDNKITAFNSKWPNTELQDSRERDSDSLDGRNWRFFALTVEERRWHWPAPAHTSAGAPDSGGVSSRTQRHRPSRKSRSRLRTARNTCAVTGWSGWHSIIHGRLAHNQQPISYYLF